MNPMRSLLVHIDGSVRVAARLALARDLATRHQATLTALFATTPAPETLPFAYAASAVSVNLLQELHTQWLGRAKAAYEQVVASGTAPVAWAELGGEPLVQGFVEQAWCADLLVLGQADPAEPVGQELPAGFVETVLIESGKPALIVPYAGSFAAVGSNVLVAWKASRESARALAAAMPLLRGAAQVHVAEWRAKTPPRATGEALAGARRQRLRRGPPPLAPAPDEPAQVGEMLLSMATDVGADLLVMGCYSHSRARELVLGGVTRTVLRSMTIPVLMSH